MCGSCFWKRLAGEAIDPTHRSSAMRMASSQASLLPQGFGLSSILRHAEIWWDRTCSGSRRRGLSDIPRRYLRTSSHHRGSVVAFKHRISCRILAKPYGIGAVRNHCGSCRTASGHFTSSSSHRSGSSTRSSNSCSHIVCAVLKSSA
jgi:hypothetical protein